MSQPPGYSRADAKGRVAEKLDRLAKLPDAAMVTVFVGDLRELARWRPPSACWLHRPDCNGACGSYGCEGR